MTAFVSSFNPTTKRLCYTNCCHFPALLLRNDGKLEKLTTKGMAVGVIPFDTVEIRRSSPKNFFTIKDPFLVWH
ncbi:MAG: SpoIIE family protein phosphatase [Simkaniaceae bacterium]|nr:SpoIIE family protein phosphatase [Simkaniaceae bacterium]